METPASRKRWSRFMGDPPSLTTRARVLLRLLPRPRGRLPVADVLRHVEFTTTVETGNGPDARLRDASGATHCRRRSKRRLAGRRDRLRSRSGNRSRRAAQATQPPPLGSASPGAAAPAESGSRLSCPGPVSRVPAAALPLEDRRSACPRGRQVAAAPPGRQRRPRPRPDPCRPAADDRRAARWRGGAGRGRDPHQLAALGAGHVDHPRPTPAGHDPGTNRRRTIFGAVDLASGRFLYQVARKAVSATFTQFLEQLLAAYPAAPVVAVVRDNVIIHHSKIVGRWLEAHRRIMVQHGARYSPTTAARWSGCGGRSRRGRPTPRP